MSSEEWCEKKKGHEGNISRDLYFLTHPKEGELKVPLSYPGNPFSNKKERKKETKENHRKQRFRQRKKCELR